MHYAAREKVILGLSNSLKRRVMMMGFGARPANQVVRFSTTTLSDLQWTKVSNATGGEELHDSCCPYPVGDAALQRGQ